MRHLIAAVAALCALAAPAAAQKAELRAEAPSPAQAMVAEPSAAGQGAARAFLIDSGLVATAFDAAVAARFEEARTNFNRQLRGVTRGRREAALAAFDNMPNVLRDEINAQLPALVSAFAVELDGQFQPAHLVEIDAFLRTSAGQTLIRQSMAALPAAVRGEQRSNDQTLADMRTAIAGMNDEEAAALLRFGSSEAGAAFAANSGALRQSLQRAMMSAFAPALLGTITRLQGELCTALGPECPREMRPARTDSP